MSKFTDAFERGEGLYSIADVAFYAKMHPNTVRSWFTGRVRPIFRAATSSVDARFLSYTDLIEAIYVRKLRNEFHIGFPVIRTAIEMATKLKGVAHPFAHPDFRTVVVGKEINIIEKESESTMTALAPNSRQVSDTTILEQFIDELEFDASKNIIKYIAFKAPKDRVFIAPNYSFGFPMMESSGYTAETLWRARNAEGGIPEAANAYGVEDFTVKAAVDYFEGILECRGLLRKAA
jgi:hypothetical protein